MIMAKFPTYEEMGKKVAEKALDEFLHDGKSIREWMQIIASEDAISRQVVLSKIKEVCFSEEWEQFRVDNGSNGQRDFLINYIEQLSSVSSSEKSDKCDDAISRQAVLDATVNKNSIWNSITNSKGENLEEIISQLPPVNLQGSCSNCCNDNQLEKAKLCQKSYLAGMKHKQESFNDNILTLTETLTKRVITQVTEDMDNFIFTTIKPWCEAKEQREISKRDLEQALTQYFSKEPCEDAISREAVMMELDKYLCGVPFDEKGIDIVIKELPSVKPQIICPIHGVDCEDCSAYEKKLNKWIGAEVLDKIRAEIESLKPCQGSFYDGITRCLEIIDKYKAESEN